MTDPGRPAPGPVPALVAEASRRSAVLWVSPSDPDLAAPVWHLWHAERAYVLTGGAEQPWPAGPAAERVVVVVRNKDRQSDRLVQWEAAVAQVAPGSPEWDEVVPLLHARRLNPPGGGQQPARWAQESVLRRLSPTGRTVPVERGRAAGRSG